MKTKIFDYTTVLTTLQQIAPEAHIAGGAVRDTKTIDKADIAAQLRNMTDERLFGDKPWPINNNAAVHQQLINWGLIVEIDKAGTCITTALGRELSVDTWSAFIGHHELSEIPELLAMCGLLTWEEADHIIDDRWERGGETLEAILPPILRRVYRAQPR